MMQKSPAMLSYARNLMLEAVRIADAEKVADTGSMVDAAMKVILEMPETAKTSMLQDVLADRETEVDAFAGTICQKAALYQIPVPFNQDVLDKLK
jgi:2-dehydropantoate 2-reductase